MHLRLWMNFIFIQAKKLLDNKFLKTFIFVVFVAVIYHQLTNTSNWQDISLGFNQSLEKLDYLWLFCFVILVPINWLIEALKWRVVLSTEYELGLFTSLKAIVSGLSLAIITPNRIGEYGGRLVCVPSEYNWLSVVSTFVGSVGQNLVTILFGIVGLYALHCHFPDVLPLNLDSVFLFAILFVLAAIYLFFNIDILAKVGKRSGLSKYIQAFRKPLIYLRDLGRAAVAQVLALSLLRFFIYSFQYYFVLRFFGVEISFLLSFFAIWSVFIIQSGIPLPPFLSVLARGEIALIVWGLFDVNELTILAITFTIWLINLVTPAILGLFNIMNTNILSALGYEIKT